MKRLLKILLLLSAVFCISHVCAQEIPDSINDDEQQYLSTCYYYAGLLGYNIDSIINPDLYKIITGWLGTRYHYSGYSKEGIDCSDFAATVYRDAFNKTLTGSSADIYNAVEPLKKSELKEGDLVFFKIRKRRISHVGIYLSHNRFIHASVHEGVVVSSLDSPYYKKRFFKGGRLKEDS